MTIYDCPKCKYHIENKQYGVEDRICPNCSTKLIASGFERPNVEEKIRIPTSSGIWENHKNDPDKLFPSNPHLKNIDTGEKLNPLNWTIYDKKGRTPIKKLPKKDAK